MVVAVVAPHFDTPTVNFFEKLSTPLWITKPNFPRGFRRVVNLSGNLWFADGFVTANRRLPFIGNKARAAHYFLTKEECSRRTSQKCDKLSGTGIRRHIIKWRITQFCLIIVALMSIWQKLRESAL
jgi:hypothetical protein